MLCSIGSYQLTDGTLSGGVALTNLRLSVDRVFEIVVPLPNALDANNAPVLFDRGKRRITLDFTVIRVHDTARLAEQFCLDHDADIPSAGDVQLTAVSPTESAIALVLNAKLLTHELVQQLGATTFHHYHVTGTTIDVTIIDATGFIAMEDGGDILTEDGSKIKLEH